MRRRSTCLLLLLSATCTGRSGYDRLDTGTPPSPGDDGDGAGADTPPGPGCTAQAVSWTAWMGSSTLIALAYDGVTPPSGCTTSNLVGGSLGPCTCASGSCHVELTPAPGLWGPTAATFDYRIQLGAQACPESTVSVALLHGAGDAGHLSFSDFAAALDDALTAGASATASWSKSTQTYGSTFPGLTQFTGAVLADNGLIFAIPAESRSVLVIDPRDEASSHEVPLAVATHSFAFQGGVLAFDGTRFFVYGLPHLADASGRYSFLKIDPQDGSATEVGVGTISGGGDRVLFNNGAVGLDGNIYLAPAEHYQVLRFDPRTESTTFIATPFATFSAAERFSAAVLAPNGRIYVVPFNVSSFLVIDPTTDGGAGSTSIPPALDGVSSDFCSGVVGANGRLYFIPGCADVVGVIIPGATPATDVYATLSAAPLTGDFGCGKYFSAALGPDGKVYGIPGNNWASGIRPILQVDTTSESLSFIGNVASPYFFAWQGAVAAPNGRVYGVPSQTMELLIIDTHANAPLGLGVLLAPYFDKW